MKRVRNYRVLRPVAWWLAVLCLAMWNIPPAAAFRKPQQRKPGKTQTLDAETRAKLAHERDRKEDIHPLSDEELGAFRGKGYRNKYFSGVLPWQRSFHNINLCNGNLFLSNTDVQVSPARGAGLAWQRTYNSNDARVGPFGIGWSHAYDIRVEGDGNNIAPRTD